MKKYVKKYVKVPIKTYIELENNANRLLFLESCGVDNWDPGMSISEYEEMNECSLNFKESDISYEIIEE